VRLVRPEPRRAGGRLRRGRPLQTGRAVRVERDFERAGSTVLDVDTRLAAHGVDPRVVELEAADREIEERPALVRLDVRRQHPRRRPRRAAADRPIVYHGARDAPHRELARDRGADDPGADDHHAVDIIHANEDIAAHQAGLQMKATDKHRRTRMEGYRWSTTHL